MWACGKRSEHTNVAPKAMVRWIEGNYLFIGSADSTRSAHLGTISGTERSRGAMSRRRATELEPSAKTSHSNDFARFDAFGASAALRFGLREMTFVSSEIRHSRLWGDGNSFPLVRRKDWISWGQSIGDN